VSTADARTRTFTPSDRLEADLLALFAVQPSAELVDRLDERLERELRAWDPAAARRARLRVSRRAGLIGLIAATFVIGGATGSLQSLYAFLTGPFDVPWHRGVELNLSQVVDGYRVTIDRAYADSTRLALAISVVDERERPGTTQLMAMSTVVTDESGEYSGMGAVSGPDGPFAAANVIWKVPAALPLPSGPRKFHVVMPHIEVRDDSTPPPDAERPDADGNGWTPWHSVAGPWTFDFELTVDGGTTITPAAVAEVDGVRVGVPRLIAAPNIVRVEMRIDGSLPPGDWSPVGEVRHGRRVLRFTTIAMEPDGSMSLMTDGGVGGASGEWTVTIKELIDGIGDARLPGPWVLRFTAP
jgi:hypothetical protein